MKTVDEKTKNELVRALADRDDFVGAVIVGVIANKTPREIALEQGHKNAGMVKAFILTIDILTGEHEVDPRMWKSNYHAERIAKDMLTSSLSSSDRAQLESVIAACDRVRGDDDGDNVGDDVIAHQPGVYVYTYPQYMRSDIISADGRTLYKVGASAAGVGARLERQRRKTEVHEDPIVVRVFASTSPFEDEKRFHSILSAAGHSHSSSSGGVEWFNTSLDLIDAIADALALNRVV